MILYELKRTLWNDYMQRTDPQLNSTIHNWTQRPLCSLFSPTNRSLLSLNGFPRCQGHAFDGWERVAPLKMRFRRFWTSRPNMLPFSTPGSESFPKTNGNDLSTLLSESSRKKWEKRPIWPNLTRQDNLDRTRRPSGDMIEWWLANQIWIGSVRDLYCLTSLFDHMVIPEWSTR